MPTPAEITVREALERALERLRNDSGDCTESDDLALAISHIRTKCANLMDVEL